MLFLHVHTKLQDKLNLQRLTVLSLFAFYYIKTLFYTCIHTLLYVCIAVFTKNFQKEIQNNTLDKQLKKQH